MRQIDMVVFHCSDSPQGRGDDAATIHAWHLGRKFSGIGYHWVVLEDGTIQAGRPEYWRGAHARGNNKNSIGVCLIGRDEFTSAQLSALVDLSRDICSRYPQAKLVNHYDLDPGKTCPNMNLALLVELELAPEML